MLKGDNADLSMLCEHNLISVYDVGAGYAGREGELAVNNSLQ